MSIETNSDTEIKLEAKWLGQLLLMQSVLYNLPTKDSIINFVNKGITDLPGIGECDYQSHQTEITPENMVRFPLSVQEKDHGVFLLKIDDHDKFSPYQDYINNFFFAVGVILEERYQRRLNQKHQESIEQSLDQRTLQLLEEIKERKETENNLREITLQHRLVLKASNDGFFDFNVKEQKITYSDRWFTMLGYEPDELPHTYDTWISLLRPENRDYVEKGVWEAINANARWNYEFEMRRKDGTYAWILVRGMIVEKDGTGSPVRILGTHTDITKRKQAELLLNAVGKIAKIGGWEIDMVTGRSSWTKGVYDIAEFEYDQSIPGSNDHIQYYLPEYRDFVAKKINDLIENGGQMEYEAQFTTQKGNVKWCRAIGQRTMVNGVCTAINGTLQDITAFKEAEAELTKYRENLEQLVKDRTNELEETLSILQKTQSQLILFEKMGALRHLISGIAHEINNPLGAIDASNEILLNNLQKITVNIDKLAGFLKSPFGVQFGRILEKSFSSCASSVTLTTRERRKLCEEITATLEKFNVPNAYEISNKLISMKIYDNIEPLVPALRHEDVLEKLGILSEIINSITACDTIAIAVSKASKIVNALKQYIRKDTDDQGKQLPFKPVDIRMCLDNVLLLFQNSTKNFINVELNYGGDLPEIIGSQDELNQVWTNLIQNSIYAMGNGGTLTIDVTAKDNGILVKIRDDGCGMSEEVKNKVFEPLFTTKPAGEGTGLGMDIVYNIVVNNHHGAIEVESKPEVGTTISVWLPART